MGKLIILYGDLAAGKTTYGRKVATTFSIPFFCKDQIKETLCDNLEVPDREMNLRLSHLTIELMFSLFAQFAAVGRPLILESNFHPAELIRLKRLTQEAGYDVLALYLIGNPQVLHRRFLARLPGRHFAHTSVDFSRLEDFTDYLNKSRFNGVFDNTVTIDCSDLSYQDDCYYQDLIARFLG